MIYNSFGRTGWNVSEISFGAWAIGGTWGKVNDSDSLNALHRAVDLGVNFIDTADVYGDGRSERLVGRLKRERSEEIYIATKIGRRSAPHTVESYSKTNLTKYIERSLKNLRVDAIDLIQLHCPPTQIYYMPEIFDILDGFVQEGKIKYYGVSVEKVEEGMKVIKYPNAQSVQIIFNMFRQRPAELFFELAKKKKVAVIARVPLASGLLTGKFSSVSQFSADDHRNFNRNGEAFDQGETFSGIEFTAGLRAVDDLRSICPESVTLGQFALRWILMFDAVTCAIPGAKNVLQVEENINAANQPPLSAQKMDAVRRTYVRHIKTLVHHRW